MSTFRRFSLIAAFACVVFPSANLLAAFSLPDPLPTTPFRIAFVTSEGTTVPTAPPAAQSFTIADANQWVTNHRPTDPRLAGLTWTAIASTALVNARTNTSTDPVIDDRNTCPIYNTHGELIATGYADLWATTALTKPIVYDELGNTSSYANAWTGSNDDGTASSSPLGANGARATYGNITSVWYWANSTMTARPNSDSYPLYGLSSPIDVPEPATLSLLITGLLGVGGFLSWRRRRGADV